MGQVGLFHAIYPNKMFHAIYQKKSVPKWHLASHLAGTDFFSTRARGTTQKIFRFRHKRIWVDSACLEMEEKVYLKLWTKLGCPLQYTQIAPHDPAQFAARMRRTRWCKRQEEMLARPAMSLREGLSLDTKEVRIHMARGEDVCLTSDKDNGESVYMPTTLTHIWTAHRAIWAVHIR